MEAYRKALALNPHIFDPGQTRIMEEASYAAAAGRRQLLPGQNLRRSGKDAGSPHLLAQGAGSRLQRPKTVNEGKEFAALRSTPEFHQLMLEQHGGE